MLGRMFGENPCQRDINSMVVITSQRLEQLGREADIEHIIIESTLLTCKSESFSAHPSHSKRSGIPTPLLDMRF